MSPPDLQRKILEKVTARFKKRSLAVETLSNLLKVSKDGIYRRLRGESALSPQEISLLAHNFNLSIDAILFEQSEQILFSYSLFSQPVTGIHDYVKEVYKQAQLSASLREVQVSYATQEIPIFLYYVSPVLFRLKMYIYARTYWQLPSFREKAFSFDLIPEEACMLARQTAAIYNSLPSLEVWRPSLLDNTLSQVLFLATAGLFAHPEDSLLVLNAIQELMDHAKAMAKNGRKSAPGDLSTGAGGNYRMFYNEYSSTNDTILLESAQDSILFTSFGMPNFLTTRDSRLLEQIRSWFQELTNNSTSMTSHAAKNRERFFNQLSRKIQLTRERLMIFLEEMGY
jgi:hypothetical protein